VTTWIGIASTTLALGSALWLRKWGWRSLALFSPMALLFFSVAFFCALWPGAEVASINYQTLTMPLALIVGTATNLCIRACKFSLVDVSKEVAFTSMAKEEQFGAKASIDGVTGAVGRSGVAVIAQVLLITFGGLSAMTWVVAVLVVGVLTAWTIAVNVVHRSLPTPRREVDPVFEPA